MRRFFLRRLQNATGTIQDVGRVADGILFKDGSVALRSRASKPPHIAVMASIDAVNAFLAPRNNVIVWVDPEPPRPKTLTYAATARCKCGAGLAYRSDCRPQDDMHAGSITILEAAWTCSWILRAALSGNALTPSDVATHDKPLHFSMVEIKSEGQPSAEGATTRPADDPIATPDENDPYA